MKLVSGKYNTAKVFTDTLEPSCEEQIRGLLDLPAFSDARVRIMPDCHAGASCVIGFTADLGDKVIPNIVGVDIGCGMLTVELGPIDIDLARFDAVVRERIPHGRDIHDGRKVRYDAAKELTCYRELKSAKYVERALGTLGGGNHFIEIDEDDDGNKYLVIHTGSRRLGKEVCQAHQDVAWHLAIGMEELWDARQKLIYDYKATGRRAELKDAVAELHRQFKTKTAEVPKDLAYLHGKYTDNYIHDMQICQDYANENRRLIADLLCDGYGLVPIGSFTTVHNYIDHDTNMIRKGAVSAKNGERILIPINMRDGSLICVGKGNDDWNQSAPHGAGRRYSRTEAAQTFTLEEYQATMDEAGVYSTCINWKTIDESPMAYKDASEIVDNIEDTATVVKTIQPIYNFKSYFDSPKQEQEGKDASDK